MTALGQQVEKAALVMVLNVEGSLVPNRKVAWAEKIAVVLGIVCFALLFIPQS